MAKKTTKKVTKLTEDQKKTNFMILKGGQMGLSADQYKVKIIDRFGLKLVKCHCKSIVGCTGYELGGKAI